MKAVIVQPQNQRQFYFLTSVTCTVMDIQQAVIGICGQNAPTKMVETANFAVVPDGIMVDGALQPQQGSNPTWDWAE